MVCLLLCVLCKMDQHTRTHTYIEGEREIYRKREIRQWCVHLTPPTPSGQYTPLIITQSASATAATATISMLIPSTAISILSALLAVMMR